MTKADHFRIEDYAVWVHQNGNTVVLISGNRVFYEILRDSFPAFHFSPAWPDQFGRYDWGAYINNIGESERDAVRKLLDLLQTTVCIDDALNQTFALDYHMRPFQGRTEMAEIVYNAKYQQNRDAEISLVNHFESFINCHPSYARSDLIIAVPPSKPGAVNLSIRLVQELCDKLGVDNGQQYVRKTRQTQPMKDIETLAEKFNNIRGAFEFAQQEPLDG